MTNHQSGETISSISNLHNRIKLSNHESLVQYQEALDLLSLHFSVHSGIELSNQELTELAEMIYELENDYPNIISQQSIV